MKLPRGTEWMAHCLVALSACEDIGPLAKHTLAEMFDIPDAYLSKQLQQLVRAGIIRSSAGNRGGYFLARPASTVTLLDVIKTVQGDAPLFVCEEVRCRGIFTDDADAIRETGPCGIHHAMVEAENRWRDSLATVTVEALTQQIGEQGVTRMRDFARAHRANY